ncbi:MAG: hypothetical protein ACLP9L_16115 [Thermoguttaceae bacterium]
MNPSDETTILRFASGEMDAEEESTFLAQCEMTPLSWREAVLAVAEHRRLVESLGDLAIAERGSSPIAGRAKQGPGRWRLAAVAAAALVAGLLLGVAGARATGFVHGRETQVVQAPPVLQPAPAVSLASDDVTPATAMVYPADLLRMEPIIPEAQRAVLREHGFQVEEEPTLYIITEENGTRWAVPTQRAVLQYVKR